MNDIYMRFQPHHPHESAPKRGDVRGFRDLETARRVTSNMARGLSSAFLLVQDHHGLYHFVRIFPSARNEVKRILSYVGATVIEEYNSNGDQVS